MGRLVRLERILDCFSLPTSPSACVCSKTLEDDHGDEEQEEGEEGEMDAVERNALLQSHMNQIAKLRDFLAAGDKTLAFHLEPKTVVLRVSMHCGGCAKKVEKHIAKMEGVTSFEVDLENKKVIVVGDITPIEVLESVSKVKFARLWLAP